MNGANGSGVEFNAYDAWGAIMQSVVSPDIRYRFTGQEDESQTTGIYNFRARMYDQSLGRFYAADPAGQNFSPFGYAGNNPLSFVDPTGGVRAVSPTSFFEINSLLAIQDLFGGGQSFDASYGAADAYAAEVLGSGGIYNDGSGGYVIGNVHIYGKPQPDQNGNLQLGGVVHSSSGWGYYEVRYWGSVSATAYVMNSEGKFVPIGEPTTTWAQDVIWVPVNSDNVSSTASLLTRGALNWLDGLFGWHLSETAKNIISSLATPFGAPGAQVSNLVTVGEYTLSTTVANHLNDISKAGELVRPYLNSPLTIQQIIEGGVATADEVPGLMRYTAEGTFKGSQGTWELVVDPSSKIIYHFLFKSR